MTSARLVDVHKRFGEHVVLRGFSAELPLSGVTYVVGKSGGGKSVVCRLAVGLLKPDQGQVFLLGEAVHALPERALVRLRAQVPYLVQGPALLDWLTLERNVALARPGADERERARTALARVGLGGLEDRLPAEVGPGIKKRTAIARALVLEPTCLILDEPTTGLDRDAKAQVNETIAELKRQGTGALVVSHDYASLALLADRVVEVKDGLAGYQGEPRGFLDRAGQDDFGDRPV